MAQDRQDGRMVRCYRCRRLRSLVSPDARLWNAEVRDGTIMGFLCPGCQTTQESAEAEENLRTIDYSTEQVVW